MCSSKQIRSRFLNPELWQRGYHEHVIRWEADYREFWEHIGNNPAKWAEDRYFAEK